MLEQAQSLWFDTTQQDVLISSKPPSAAFGPLLRTVFAAILEVFLMCLMGWVLAKKGILDKKTQKQLNRVNVSLFTPCLLFSKVAFSLSPHKLKELWIIPILFVVVTGVSALIAYLVGTALRLRKSQRNFAMAASMFNNSNSLPIALMQSLVVTVPGLKWGGDDNQDAMLGRALGYLVLYSTLGMMLRWSYGVHLLAQSDEETPAINQQADVATSEPSETENDLTASPSTSVTPSPSSSSSRLSFGAGANGNAAHRLHPPPLHSQSKRFFSSFPNSPARSSSPSPTPTPEPGRITFTIHSPRPFDNARERPQHANAARRASNREHPDSDACECPDVSDSEWGTYRPARQPHAQPSSTRFEYCRRRAMFLLKKFIKGFLQFMTMPLYAALASLIVALTPPLQHVLSEHVQPVKGFLASAGNCSIPVTLVVLGAYFHQEPSSGGKELNATARVSPAPPSPANGRVESARAGANGKRSNNVMEPHAGSPDEFVLPTHNQQLSLSRTTTRTAISNAETDGPPSSPWASATTLADGVRDMFKMCRVRGRRLLVRRNKNKPGSSEERGNNIGGGNKLAEGETKTVFVSIISRMILAPTIILPMVAALAVFDLHPVFDDPVFVCSTVLLISSPPALTLAQITQAASGDAFERLISRTIFWAYCIFTPPLTLFYVIIALHFSRL